MQLEFTDNSAKVFQQASVVQNGNKNSHLNIGDATRQSPSTGQIGEFVAPDFWTALSREVSGLRETFESSEDEYDPQEHALTNGNLDEDSTFGSLLFKDGSLSGEHCSLPVLSMSWRKLLLDLYRRRVDNVFKVLHWPSVLKDIEATHSDVQATSIPQSTQALEYAIYFMALCTVTDEESEELLLGSKAALMHHCRIATEIAIANANFLRTPSIASLQAFVLYLVSICSSRVRSIRCI